MRTKIPSSLKWLVDRRARTLAKRTEQMRRAEMSTHEASRLVEVAASLQADLDSIDRVLSLHEIAVDPSIIRPRRTPQGMLLPYGKVTRAIYACLRAANGEWRSTTEVLAFVTQRQGLAITSESYAHARLVVRRRLKAMVAAGKIRRRHEGRTHLEGYWALLERPNARPSPDR